MQYEIHNVYTYTFFNRDSLHVITACRALRPPQGMESRVKGEKEENLIGELIKEEPIDGRRHLDKTSCRKIIPESHFDDERGCKCRTNSRTYHFL